MRTRILAPLALPLALLGCDTLSGAAGGAGDWPYPSLGHKTPLLIGHRGASGALPEHTLPAYQRALNDGADCIEPDLVFSKDGVLMVRHDTYLSTTTNIASKPEFASRKRTSPDPEFKDREDWWVADFTLAELKTLRAVQPFKNRSLQFDGLYQIPTFDEALELAKSRVTVASKPVCVFPEAKSPAYHALIGHTDMAEKILATLEKHGLAAKGSPVFIQSFEPDFVKKIDAMTELPVVMLVSDKAELDAAMAIPGAPFWQGLGPSIAMLRDESGKSAGVIEAAHAKGIEVHPWTFRDDQPIGGKPIETSIREILALGVDGFFTDFPITGYRVRGDVVHGAE
ncbi:MAG: glycerophosphodiester phosphodiesterase family protein [Hyphomonadaceae bacterium]